ncbi:MAG TPA: hypothetical protein VM425_00420 [Myxococcota bacterium]|nr:hypothetical protein [Myxococcota bacterium]
MRCVCMIVAFIAAGVALAGCGEVAIGQPCTFSWPKDSSGDTNCQDYPTCAPLMEIGSGTPTLSNINMACPIDCIQLPSLQCTNLICVATQIEGNHQNMNGQCSEELAKGTDCNDAPVGCMGYCTKECMSDASCPKGYSCSPMAPFGSTLKCDDELKWDTECTSFCTEVGASPPGHTDVTCPSSDENDTANYGYGKCDQPGYAGCCACICYRYCPLLSKKFCRWSSWKESLFPDATSLATGCGN